MISSIVVVQRKIQNATTVRSQKVLSAHIPTAVFNTKRVHLWWDLVHRSCIRSFGFSLGGSKFYITLIDDATGISMDRFLKPNMD